MDKFGIFNIINALSGVLKKAETPENGKESPDKNVQKSPETTSAELRAKSAPLQNTMLSTMRSHDEFVKRVKQTSQNRKDEVLRI